MELLTILYAMLAALTGVSVGEAAPARQSLVASAQAERVEVAVAAARAVAVTPAGYARHGARLLLRQDALAEAAPERPAVAGPLAWIDLGRRHL
jgi:hypothetical protein